MASKTSEYQNEVQTYEIQNDNMEISALQEVPIPVVQDEGPPRKKPCLDTVQSDHIHPVHTSPGKLHQELEKSNEKVLSLKKKFKSSQQKSRRLKKKVTSLKEIVKQLRKHDLISSNCKEMLNQTFSGVPLALMKRMTAKKSGKGSKYSPELKSFAQTLQFYSAKAY